MATKITHRTIGSLWTPQFTWTVGGSVTDPTTIVVQQQDAAGTETYITTAASPASLTPSSTPLARVSQGVYKLNPGTTLGASGYWFVKATGTGAAQATVQEQVIVDPDEFTLNAGLSDRALVGLAETKDWLQEQNIDYSNDLDLVRVINDISQRAYEESGGREFKAKKTQPETRQFDADLVSHRSRRVDVGEMASAPTAVSILSSDWTTTIQTLNVATDIRTWPPNRAADEPITQVELKSTIVRPRIGMRVSVTGTFGFPAVPGTVRQAVLDAVAATMDRDVESYRQDFAPATGGQGTNVVVLPQQTPQFLSMPPEALAVLRAFRPVSVA